MSNFQAGTRGLSAGDWIRLKRIQGTRPTQFPLPTITIPVNAPPSNTLPGSGVAFVLACIDPRFASALEAYLAEELAQVGFFTYDLFILAGASLGGNLTGPSGCSVVSTGSNWQATLLDHIQAAITLHNVTSFYVVDHLLCGAYSNCVLSGGPDTSPTPHSTEFDTLKALIDGTSFFANGTGTATPGSTIFPTWQGLYFDVPVGSQTSLRDYTTGTEQFVEYFPPNTTAKVLVLGCIDPRFNALLTSFLVNYKEVQFIYDLFILAGASLGVNQSYNTDGTPRTSGSTGTAYPNNALAPNPGRAAIGPIGATWGSTFFDHLSIARLLHQITEVWVFDHLDCGAYKLIKLNDGTTPLVLPPDNDIAPHTEELLKLQARINTYTSGADYLTNPPTHLAFKGFVIDDAGGITKVVDDGGGIRFGNKPPGSSRIRNPASNNTDSLAFNSADFVTQSHTGTCTTHLRVTRLCTCYPSTLATKSGNCAKCKNGIVV
jgi:carbonic anhydrase